MKEISVREGWDSTKKDPNNYHDSDKNPEIMDLLPIPKLKLLASAGLDKKICLWKMDTLQPK